jgi:hypothetical protein
MPFISSPMTCSRRRRKRVRSANVGTSTSIRVSSMLFPALCSCRTIAKLADCAASRTKSATSVASLHWRSAPRRVRARKEMFGVAGARDAASRRATCESGWDGCSRKTVGGASGVLEGEGACGPFGCCSCGCCCCGSCVC